MIYINKNTTNNFVLTLNESSRLANPFYLFEFTNEYNLNSDPIFWTQLNISNCINRYNLFELIESPSGSITGGTMNSLSLIPGQYDYKIFESTGQTLSISATTGRIVENGRMVVAGVPSSSTNNTNSIYN